MARQGTYGRGAAAGAVLLGVTAVAQPPPSKPEPPPSTASAAAAHDALEAFLRESLPPSGTDATERKPVAQGPESFPCEGLEIMSVVIAHKQAIQQCMAEQKKREPGRGGTLTMRWTLRTNGRVKDVSCQTPELCSSYFASCLTGLIQGWSFPKPGTRREPIDFPFTF